MQILLNNAYEAWKSAIYYHDRIEKGFTTLEFQKGFVSSLHNSIELFLKQIMLDNKDHDVATLRNVKEEDDVLLQLKYIRADDLNQFFFGCSVEQLDKFFSIEYSQLQQRANKLLSTEDSSKGFVTDSLKTLGALRNSETHFYINENYYLSESNFVILHNFMILFFDLIAKKKLFPHAIIKFDKPDTYKLYEQEKKMEFSRNQLSSFSYVEVLKNNHMVCELKHTLQNLFEDEYVCCGNDDYSLALSICLHNEEYRASFDDLYIILQLMRKYKLFEIARTLVEAPEELGGHTYPEEHLKLNY